jgi:hypothetical protein
MERYSVQHRFILHASHNRLNAICFQIFDVDSGQRSLNMRMKKLFITMTTGLLALSFFAFNTPYLRAEKEKAFYVGMDKCKECHLGHVDSYPDGQ